MRPKSTSGASCDAKGLTFCWRGEEGAFLRLLSAVLLAVAILLTIWCSIRVVVPASTAGDGPRVSGVQIIALDEESHSSLVHLLSERSLPSLGGGAAIDDAPMLAEMLSLLGLQEERESLLPLYPAVVVEAPLRWSQEEPRALTLPALPAVEEEHWPRLAEGEDVSWEIVFSGRGGLRDIFEGRALPWQQAVPSIRQSEWSVVFDSDGSLVFAAAVDSVDREIEKEIRRKLVAFFGEGGARRRLVSGLVKLTFERRGH